MNEMVTGSSSERLRKGVRQEDDAKRTPPAQALAKTVCDGVGVRAGSRVSITLTTPRAYAWCAAMVAEIYRRGALPQVMLAADDFDRSALHLAPGPLLSEAGPVELAALDWSDIHIALRGMEPPTTGEVDPARVSAQRVAKGLVSTHRWNHTRWAIVRVPTAAWAELVGMTSDELDRQFLAGCLLDWPTWRERWGSLVDVLQVSRTVTIRHDGDELHLPVTGRSWALFAGEANFPDGEIATAPLEDQVEGTIRFPQTFWFAGQRFSDLRLAFDAGRCVDLSAAFGQNTARALIDTDAGSDRVGELAIGLNHELQRAVGDLFFDEKILGTMHLALGRAYPECGGVNRSSLHWDLVKDLRTPGAELLVDNEVWIDAGRPVGPLAKVTGQPNAPEREKT